jgi:hypothetical protein
LLEHIPVIELGPPAFCAFADMNVFPPVMTLAGSAAPESVTQLSMADAQR